MPGAFAKAAYRSLGRRQRRRSRWNVREQRQTTKHGFLTKLSISYLSRATASLCPRNTLYSNDFGAGPLEVLRNARSYRTNVTDSAVSDGVTKQDGHVGIVSCIGALASLLSLEVLSNVGFLKQIRPDSGRQVPRCPSPRVFEALGMCQKTCPGLLETGQQ